MSDQPTDRPPRYGGPRNRNRSAADVPRRDPTDVPPRTAGESERRSRTPDEVRPPDAPPRPPDGDPRGGQSPRYGEAYRRSRTPPERAPRKREFEDRAPAPREREAAVGRSADADLLEAFEPLEFETAAQKRVYRHVERRGVVDRGAVEAHLDLAADDLAASIRRLERKGYLEERDGRLRVARNTDVETKYAAAGVEVTIRPARQEDLADLVDLIRAVTDDGTYVVAESVAAQLAYEGTVIRHTDARSRTFFVAEVDAEGASDSRLVGWGHLTLPGIEHLDHTAELTVGVHPEFRRRGIGGQLMRIALAWAAANDYYKAYQSLPGTNRAAIDFLAAHGWTAEAVRGDHYRIDGEFVDEVMMAYAL